MTCFQPVSAVKRQCRRGPPQQIFQRAQTIMWLFTPLFLLDSALQNSLSHLREFCRTLSHYISTFFKILSFLYYFIKNNRSLTNPGGKWRTAYVMPLWKIEAGQFQFFGEPAIRGKRHFPRYEYKLAQLNRVYIRCRSPPDFQSQIHKKLMIGRSYIMNYDMRQSGNRIRQLRIKNGLTQEKAAAAVKYRQKLL